MRLSRDTALTPWRGTASCPQFSSQGATTDALAGSTGGCRRRALASALPTSAHRPLQPQRAGCHLHSGAQTRARRGAQVRAYPAAPVLFFTPAPNGCGARIGSCAAGRFQSVVLWAACAPVFRAVGVGSVKQRDGLWTCSLSEPRQAVVLAGGSQPQTWNRSRRCRVRKRVTSLACRWVEVVARRDLEAGEELLLDYGERSQRDFLQGYAFTPPDNPHEVDDASFCLAQASVASSNRMHLLCVRDLLPSSA